MSTISVKRVKLVIAKKVTSRNRWTSQTKVVVRTYLVLTQALAAAERSSAAPSEQSERCLRAHSYQMLFKHKGTLAALCSHTCLITHTFIFIPQRAECE